MSYEQCALIVAYSKPFLIGTGYKIEYGLDAELYCCHKRKALTIEETPRFVLNVVQQAMKAHKIKE